MNVIHAVDNLDFLMKMLNFTEESIDAHIKILTTVVLKGLSSVKT